MVYDLYGIGLADEVGILDVTHDRYAAPLSLLLPNGPAWPRDDETMVALITAITVEYSRLAVRAAKLGRELDPATTFECVADWEASYGLPDCATPETLAGRRAAIAAKLLAQTGHDQSPSFWAALIKALGYTLQYSLKGEHGITCVDGCMDEVMGDEWAFVWQMIIDSGADDALLDCVVSHNAWIGTLPIVHHPWTNFGMMIPALRGVACTPTGFIAAGGDGGEQLYTTTDLDSWLVSGVWGDDLKAVCAVGETLVSVGDLADALVSTDGGATWLPYPHGAAVILYGVSRGHEDDQVVVAVGAAGVMLRSPDAGQTWAALAVLTAETLSAVTSCTGAVIAVGAAGTVLRSDDNGATWAVIAAGIAIDLRSVTAWGSTVIAVGNAIWRSADAGLTWAEVDVPADTLNAVTSSPSGRWTACGTGGVITQSRDDGLTWIPQTSLTTDDLFCACPYLPGGRAVLIGDRFVLE